LPQKNLITSVHKQYDQFYDACRQFGSGSLELAKVLQDIAKTVTSESHKQKIVVTYNGIKELGPQIIRAAKRSFDEPTNEDHQQELHLLARQLTQKISFALSASQTDTNEVSKTQPTVPLPRVDVEENKANRKKTIKDSNHGADVLRSAKNATIAKQIDDDIEEGSKLLLDMTKAKKQGIKPNEVKPDPVIPEETKKKQDEDLKQVIKGSFVKFDSPKMDSPKVEKKNGIKTS